MSDQDSTLISPSNLQTVVAVCFVLALLSVAFNFYNFTRINAVYGVLRSVQNTTTADANAVDSSQNDKIDKLEKQLENMKEKMQNMREKAKSERMEDRMEDKGEKAKGKKGG